MAALAAAAGKDVITLKNHQVVADVTVLREGFDKVEIDRAGEGKTDDSIPADTVDNVTYSDQPTVFAEGKVSFRFGRWDKAVESFSKALEDKTARAFWLQPYANFYIAESKRKLAETNAALFPEARAAYEETVKAAPDGRLLPYAFRGTGLCLMREGKLDRARAEFQKLLDPKYGGDWALRGKLLLAQVNAQEKQHQEAMRLCDEVIRQAELLKRADLAQEARAIRPELLMAAGEYVKAREILLQVAQATPERDADAKARAYNCIGDCLLAEKSAKEALLAYLRVRVLYFASKEEYPRALYGTARCFTLLKDADRAREVVALMKKDCAASPWTAKALAEFQ
jgi:tetratricopeptide (TPR) repeat protein